jgi:hypothetical protein
VSKEEFKKMLLELGFLQSDKGRLFVYILKTGHKITIYEDLRYFQFLYSGSNFQELISKDVNTESFISHCRLRTNDNLLFAYYLRERKIGEILNG